MAELYIQSVTITPNPVNVKAQYKIEVEIYTLFPAADLYPALDLYPICSGFSRTLTCIREPMYTR